MPELHSQPWYDAKELEHRRALAGPVKLHQHRLRTIGRMSGDENVTLAAILKMICVVLRLCFEHHA
jgi:hypothetical protein